MRFHGSLLNNYGKPIDSMKALKRCTLLALLLSKLTFTLAQGLPDLGDPSSSVLTPQQERHLGEATMYRVRQNLPLSADKWVQDYIQALGNRLVAQSQDTAFPYEFFVVADNRINAFALPGGFIGVNTGLILNAQDESELASVLAHESAHVSQRHIARLYAHMQRVQLSTVAGALAAIVIATQNANAGSGAIAAAMAGQQQALINFTRDNEKEADRIGMQLLVKAGYDPYGMTRFFERLYQSTQYYGQHIPEYLQTHPLTQSRIADSRARAEGYPKQIPSATLDFLLIQARVRAKSFQTPHDASHYFQKSLAQNPDGLHKVAQRYGQAIALIDMGSASEATNILKELYNLYPHTLLIEASLAESLYQMNDSGAAYAQLEKALSRHPNHLALTLQYNTWLLNDAQSAVVIQNLRQYHLNTSAQPDTLQLLSKAYAQSADLVQMHFTQADYLVMIGDFRGALMQLEQAKKSVPSPSRLLLQIEARTEEIKQRIEHVEGKPLKSSALFAF